MGKRIFVVMCLFLGIMFSADVTAQEEIRLSTYYPAPYGEYESLVVEKVRDASEIDMLRLTLTGTGDIGDQANILFQQPATGGALRNSAMISSIHNHPVNNRGNLAFYTSTTGVLSEVMRLLHDGKVGIGITGPSHILHIAGQGRSTHAAWATSSDERVKTNIKPVEGLSTLLRINPISFEYIEEYKNGNKNMDGIRRGFIAQEVESIIPEMVSQTCEKFGEKEIEDFRVLTNSDFVPILVKSVQEQQMMLEEQEEKIRTQQKEIDELREIVESLL
jgi:hypothetical protein